MVFNTQERADKHELSITANKVLTDWPHKEVTSEGEQCFLVYNREEYLILITAWRDSGDYYERSVEMQNDFADNHQFPYIGLTASRILNKYAGDNDSYESLYFVALPR